MSAGPRNKSNYYVHGEQGTCVRPKSSKRVSAVNECNRLWEQVQALTVIVNKLLPVDPRSDIL